MTPSTPPAPRPGSAELEQAEVQARVAEKISDPELLPARLPHVDAGTVGDDEVEEVAAIDDETAEALMAAEAAEAEARDLEQRVLDGDPDVTGEQLIAAEGQGRVARLRARRAAAKALDRVEQERVGRIRELEAAIEGGELADRLDALLIRYDRVAQDLGVLAQHVVEFNALVDATLDELSELGALPEGYMLPRVDAAKGYLRLDRLDVQIEQVDLRRLVLDAAWRATDVGAEPGSHLARAAATFYSEAGVSTATSQDAEGSEAIAGMLRRSTRTDGKYGLGDQLRRTLVALKGARR